MESLRGKARDLDVQLFYSKYVQYTNTQDPIQSNFSVLPGAKLINDDPKLLAEYANRREGTLFTLNNYILNMKDARDAAQGLIELIKKEYHLKQ